MGGKKLPWYMLGLSDASDMFDISGTMWMVALCFVYGMKSIWIPWLWPVFNQVFNMMFLSKWLRRSNANTGAEWLATRFGLSGTGVKGITYSSSGFCTDRLSWFFGVWFCWAWESSLKFLFPGTWCSLMFRLI